jgi:hypothetical protein
MDKHLLAMVMALVLHAVAAAALNIQVGKPSFVRSSWIAMESSV